MTIATDKLTETIIAHEGQARFVYKDSKGYSTIGCGRNVDARGGRGLTFDEQNFLLRNDIDLCRLQLSGLSAYELSDQVRADVLCELCFNMGITRLMEFKKMLQAFVKKDYPLAEKELMNSAWPKEVSASRASNICYRIVNGAYPDENRTGGD